MGASSALRHWVRTNCRFATYSGELASLRDYLKHGIDAHDFTYMLDEFLIETGEATAFPYTDEYEYVDKMPPDQKKRFEAWLGKKIATDPSIASDPLSPSYVHLNYNRLLKRNTWLVHFTGQAPAVAKEGFQKGQEDMAALGLTTYLNPKNKQPGWNFAFEAGSKDSARAEAEGKYGEDAVMFQSAGVEAYHSGDDENQVIFYGPHVQEVVPLFSGDGGWRVESRKGRVVYQNESFQAVVNWVKRNYQQYRNTISRRASVAV